MMKKVLAILVMMTLVMGLVITGCGSQTEVTSSKTTETTETAKAAETAKTPVEITFLNHANEAATSVEQVTVLNTVKQFQKDHPEINLINEALSTTDEELKIKTMAASNDLPDTFYIKSAWVEPFIKNGVIGPVDELLDADPAWKSSFLQGVFNQFIARDGKKYGLPINQLYNFTITYNSKILKDAGYDSFPTTWKDFIDVLNKIKAKGITPITFGNKDKWQGVDILSSQLTDRFTGGQWYQDIKLKKGTAKWTDPEFVNSIKAIEQLVKAGYFNKDVNSINNNQMKNLYYAGKAAMYFDGNWANGGLIKDCPKEIKDVTEFALLPAVEGGKGDIRAIAGCTTWGVSLNPKLTGAKRDAAVLLLKALTSQAYSKALIEGGSFPVTDPGTYDASKLDPLAVKYNEFVKGRPICVAYGAELSPRILDIIYSGVQEIFAGSLSPEELAQRLQAQQDKE